MAQNYGRSEGFAVQMAGPFGSISSSGKITQVALPADSWKNAESPFFQVVEIEGISVTSLVDIQASKEQMERFYIDGTMLHIENDGGTATAYAIGTKPTEDLVLQVTRGEQNGASG